MLLSVLDRKWREHLYEMDYLRAGIHLRAMANRDPVVEYQREGFDMFNAMLDGIKEESVGFLFNLEVKTKEQQEAEAAEKQAQAEAEALARAQAGTARRAGPPGRGPGRRAEAAAGRRQRRRGRRSRRRQAATPAAAAPAAAEAPERRAPGRAGGEGAGGRGAARLQLLAPPPRRLGEGRRPGQGRQDGDRDRHQGAAAQRPVPLRLGEEVQVLPRRPGQSL